MFVPLIRSYWLVMLRVSSSTIFLMSASLKSPSPVASTRSATRARTTSLSVDSSSRESPSLRNSLFLSCLLKTALPPGQAFSHVTTLPVSLSIAFSTWITRSAGVVWGAALVRESKRAIRLRIPASGMYFSSWSRSSLRMVLYRSKVRARSVPSPSAAMRQAAGVKGNLASSWMSPLLENLETTACIASQRFSGFSSTSKSILDFCTMRLLANASSSFFDTVTSVCPLWSIAARDWKSVMRPLTKSS